MQNQHRPALSGACHQEQTGSTVTCGCRTGAIPWQVACWELILALTLTPDEGQVLSLARTSWFEPRREGSSQ